MNIHIKWLAIVFSGLILIETGWSEVGPDILSSLKGDKTNEMLQIHNRAMLAAQEGNRVAEAIAYEAKTALGQDREFNRIKGEYPTLPHEIAERNETEKDWVAAVDKKAADGEAFFMVIMGVLCYNGYANVPVDKQKGLALWQKAADLNCGLAKLRVGNCYLNGVFPRDLQKAAAYYREAGETGIPMGWNNLGCLYNGWEGWSPRNLNKAMECWAKSAPMGHAWSQYNLGFFYCYGDDGFPQNKELGIQWMKAAAANGHRAAKLYLSNFVGKKPAQRTLPAVIEDKNTDVVSTFIAFDKIKESIAGSKVSVVCFVDAYEPQTVRPAVLPDKTPSQMLDIYLSGLRTYKKQQAKSSDANTINAEDVKIFIVECREDTRAKVREFDKQCQLKVYDGTIPVLYVFHLEELVKIYTYGQSPGPNGEALKLLIEGLLIKKRFSFKPRD